MWEQPEWREEVEAWIRERLAEHKLSVTGTIEQPHVRIWSTVLKIPTEAGNVFFKAASVTQFFEPALLQLLAERRPQDTLRPLAVNVARGWSLLPDGGPTMRQALDGNFDLETYVKLMGKYAKLQIAASEWPDELAATGMPVLPLAKLPGIFETILNDKSLTLVREKEDFLTQAQFDQLKRMGGEFGDMAAELAASGIPQSLEHGDLHDGNTFASGLPYDWGDASLSFPFFTLILPIRFAARKLEISEYGEHPALLQLRDAYLNEWLDFAQDAQLVRTWETAFRLGKFVRAIGWYGTVKKSESGGEEYEESVSGWMLEGLNHRVSHKISTTTKTDLQG